MPLNVSVLNPKEVIFTGEAKNVIVPGEQGIFEIQNFHQPILSRLVSGSIYIDSQKLNF